MIHIISKNYLKEVLRVKKIIKKIKPKHLARCGLLVMLCCYIAMFLCSATYTCNVTFSNPDNLPYEYSDISLSFNGGDYYTVSLGESYSLSTSFLYSNQSLFISRDGDLYIIDYSDSDETLLYEDIPVEDGYYNFLGISGVNYTDGTQIVCPQLVGYDVLVSQVSDGICVNFVYSSDVSSNFDIVLADITEVYDSENGFISNMYIILIPSPPPPQESITDAWGGVLTWITSSIASITGVFWNGSSLTLIGTLSLIGVSIALILLIINKVKDFLNLQ